MNANTIVTPHAATLITIGALAGEIMGQTVGFQSFEASEGFIQGQSVDIIQKSRGTEYDGAPKAVTRMVAFDGPADHLP